MKAAAPLRWTLISALVLGSGWAEEPPKPRCDALQRGRLWPESETRGTRRQIEICTLNVWKYQWQQLTVDISELGKGSKDRRKTEPEDGGRQSAARTLRPGAGEPLPQGEADVNSADR